MKTGTDMTTGNPTGRIVRFAFPLILTNIGQQLYQVTDAVIVGRGVGVEAFSALGATDWLYWLVLWAVQALTQGFSVLVSQAYGSKNKKKMQQSTAMSVVLCAGIGIGLTVLFVCAARPLLLLLNTPENIIDQAALYVRMLYCGSLIVISYNMSAALLRAVGDGKTPLIAMGIAGSLNVVLDLLFVLVFRWGIRGAAAATLLAQLMSFLFCLNVLRRNPIFHLSRESWQPDFSVMRELIRLGVPLALQQQVVVIGGVIAQSVVNSCGFVFLAGFTATNKLHNLLDCSASAFGFAASTFVGQNWGAGQIDRARDGVRRTLMLAVSFSLVITVVMIVFGRHVVGLFLSASEDNAAAALEIAYQYLVVMCSLLFSAYVMQVFRASLQAMGTTTAPTIAGFVEFAARVGVALLLPKLLGEKGLFFMDAAAWFSSGVFLLIAYLLFIRKLQRRKS